MAEIVCAVAASHAPGLVGLFDGAPPESKAAVTAILSAMTVILPVPVVWSFAPEEFALDRLKAILAAPIPRRSICWAFCTDAGWGRGCATNSPGTVGFSGRAAAACSG